MAQNEHIVKTLSYLDLDWVSEYQSCISNDYILINKFQSIICREEIDWFLLLWGGGSGDGLDRGGGILSSLLMINFSLLFFLWIICFNLL